MRRISLLLLLCGCAQKCPRSHPFIRRTVQRLFHRLIRAHMHLKLGSFCLAGSLAGSRPWILRQRCRADHRGSDPVGARRFRRRNNGKRRRYRADRGIVRKMSKSPMSSDFQMNSSEIFAFYLILLPQWWQKLSFAPTLQPQHSQHVPSCTPQAEQYKWPALCAAPQAGQIVMLRL